tara:strand:+ start:3837 stop:4166 length:330 start_codon:yes stop_codon:yes gene_type:complete
MLPMESELNNKSYKRIFIYAVYLSYILFFITLFGIIPINQQYYKILREVIKYFVCIFLIVKYNPFRKKKSITFDNMDRYIVFHSGIFLLITTGIIQVFENYTNIIFQNI